jgi:adenosylcobyric acid synthase
VDGRPEGAISADGRVLATYVHGIFDAPAACAALLSWAGMKGARGVDLPALREASLERLADGVEANLDFHALGKLAGW